MITYFINPNSNNKFANKYCIEEMRIYQDDPDDAEKSKCWWRQTYLEKANALILKVGNPNNTHWHREPHFVREVLMLEESWIKWPILRLLVSLLMMLNSVILLKRPLWQNYSKIGNSTVLGKTRATKMDEFSEMFQTVFDPPIFGEITLRTFFYQFYAQKALFKDPNFAI